MIQLLLRRLALGFVTVWLVSVIIFLGVEALPGDSCTAVLEREAHGEALAKCRADMGLNAPALTRYVDWAGAALQGDFGVSANGQKSISEIVGYRVRNSLLLAAGALSVGIPLSILLGAMAGLWQLCPKGCGSPVPSTRHRGPWLSPIFPSRKRRPQMRPLPRSRVTWWRSTSLPAARQAAPRR